MSFPKTPKVTFRTESDIAKIKAENPLLYLINGEIDQSKFILLAEAAKPGTLKLEVSGLSNLEYSLSPLKATRIAVNIPKDFKSSNLKYSFKFIPSDSKSETTGEGRFSIPPAPGKAWDHALKIAIISCNDVMHDYTGDLKLWKAIENINTDIKFLLGDQIYGDDVVFQMHYDVVHVWDKTDNLTPEAIKDRYDDLYRMTYHLSQTALRNGMNIMMPDDHETYDSAGTSGIYDFQDQKRMDLMKIAYESFKEHQMSLRSDQNENIYLHRQWGDIEYVGLDLRYDRYPAIWKQMLFDPNKEYEAEPTWMSKEQVKWFNDIADSAIKTKPKYFIVSTSTMFTSSNEWSVDMLSKHDTSFKEVFNHPQSKVELYSLITKLFETSKHTSVLAINGDVHKAVIGKWKNPEKQIFYELTSSAISRQPSNLEEISTIGFWALAALDTTFISTGIDEYKLKQQPITYGNNVMVATLHPDKVDVSTFLVPPRTYCESFAMQTGLRSFPENVIEDKKVLEFPEINILNSDL